MVKNRFLKYYRFGLWLRLLDFSASLQIEAVSLANHGISRYAAT
jgi:hypothetical protein